jgi:transaldolase
VGRTRCSSGVAGRHPILTTEQKVDRHEHAETTHDPLADLSAAGVSLWLDDLSRQRLLSGNLRTLIATQHIVGVTTNPSIFQAALTDGASYQQQIGELAARGADVDDTVRVVTTDDVRDATDLFSGVYSRSGGVDGRVSIEVDPRLAHDTGGTIAQAQELFKIVDRANVLIKIPATLAGLPAITAVIAEGISVNVTLIFSLDRYRAVMDAYLAGLELAKANGHQLSDIHSVASFFVSRVDLEIDKRLKVISTPEAETLLGAAAIANARLAYQASEQTFTGDRWDALAAAGANKQRPLWASTGVKDPAYDDTRYVVELVAPGTVNTAPEKTINAVADHGVIRGNTIAGTYQQAAAVFTDLAALGIELDDVFAVLEAEGVEKFEQAWNELLDSVAVELQNARQT